MLPPLLGLCGVLQGLPGGTKGRLPLLLLHATGPHRPLPSPHHHPLRGAVHRRHAAAHELRLRVLLRLACCARRAPLLLLLLSLLCRLHVV